MRRVVRMVMLGWCSASAFFFTPAVHAADAWPAKPLRVIVPLPPGGAVDIVARLAGGPLAAALGEGVIIDNRPGARNVIGTSQVAKAAPDGYTLLVISDAFTVMPFLERKLPFDVRAGFAPVSLLATQPLVLAVHTSVPVKSMREFISLARSKPGALPLATGAMGHYLALEYLQKSAGFATAHIPYKGGVPAVTDLVGGQVPAALTGQSPMIPYARSGRIRVLAVTTRTRSVALPEVPTLAEAGISGIDLFEWIFMMAPANTPREIVSRLNAELAKALVVPDVKSKLLTAGLEPAPSTPERLGAMIDESLARWGRLIPELHIQPE
jgi:tripartite-type tricarboxylate transporter receptor subunit TctC